jgi:hypothetical protein
MDSRQVYLQHIENRSLTTRKKEKKRKQDLSQLDVSCETATVGPAAADEEPASQHVGRGQPGREGRDAHTRAEADHKGEAAAKEGAFE